MCSATIQQARFKRVIFGAKDKKGGGLESLYRIAEDARLNHTFEVTSGVLEERCSDIMKSYFKNKRKNAKKAPIKPIDSLFLRLQAVCKGS